MLPMSLKYPKINYQPLEWSIYCLNLKSWLWALLLYCLQKKSVYLMCSLGASWYHIPLGQILEQYYFNIKIYLWLYLAICKYCAIVTCQNTEKSKGIINYHNEIKLHTCLEINIITNILKSLWLYVCSCLKLMLHATETVIGSGCMLACCVTLP